jgi:hypothetical protein
VFGSIAVEVFTAYKFHHMTIERQSDLLTHFLRDLSEQLGSNFNGSLVESWEVLCDGIIVHTGGRARDGHCESGGVNLRGEGGAKKRECDTYTT